jgi:hypothetical protein
MSDPFELIRLANPIPDPGQMPDEPVSPAEEALMEGIIGMKVDGSRVGTSGRKIALIAAAMLVLGAGAAGAAALFRGGNLDPAPFSGDGWQLIVGEEANDEAGTSYKVCHTFAPAEGLDETTGFGPSGCVTWPEDAPTDSTFIDVVPVGTPEGTVLFVDLSTGGFDVISTTTDGGETIEVEPFTMQGSGKRFAVVELPAGTRSATVALLDGDGAVVESRTVVVSPDPA